MFLWNDIPDDPVIRFRPLAGCGLFHGDRKVTIQTFWFPSPCGVWVVSDAKTILDIRTTVSVPLRGVGCFNPIVGDIVILKFPSPCGVWVVSGRPNGWRKKRNVSVPLRGVGCFRAMTDEELARSFPSPCGVWVVSVPTRSRRQCCAFPSPCGVWVVSLKEVKGY